MITKTETEYLEALEKIDQAYDNGGLSAKYTKEMRTALTSMRITLITNAK
jgi:hypothetical protein